MAEPQYSSFVNRDDPIPVLRVPRVDDELDTPEPVEARKSKRETLKHHADKLKGKLDGVRVQYGHSDDAGFKERVLNSLIQQIIPGEASDESEDVKDPRSHKYVDRPGFSLPAMSANFRRFNARIGIAFVFQNRLIHLFTWKKPTHTLSFLAVYTLICLQPALLSVVPVALILFFVMIPSFLARHPPPPSTASDLTSADAVAIEYHASYGYSGRPVAPPTRIKPAPDMSKDFFRNMRDLQNSMADFSDVHDAAVAAISPYTDFSDERRSTAVFLGIVLLLSFAFLAAHLVPWRAVAFVAGWILTCATHPRSQEIILRSSSLEQLRDLHSRTSNYMRDWIDADIALDEPPEIREVEIFELQRLQQSYYEAGHGGSSGESSPETQAQSLAQTTEGEWEQWLFSPLPWDPMSPSRIAGAKPTGTQFFEEVQAPRGWRWRDKKWILDLASTAWVEERCVTGVEVETEGERWVYDISYPETSRKSGQGSKGDEVKKKTATTAAAAAPKSWEEGTSKGRKGDWRRRRWVRLVERKVVKMPEDRPPTPGILKLLDPGVTSPGIIEPAAVE